MTDTEVGWGAVLASERFKRLARQRRNIIVGLGLLAAIYYFSIPALIAWAPEFFKIRLMSGINLGSIFAVSQYPFGGVISYVFLRQTARIDKASADVKAASADALAEQSHAC